MSTIINGTSSAITFPDSSVLNTSAIVSGYVPYANLPAGSVLQVVQGTLTTNVSTTSASFVTTGLSATITPKYSTSKILAIVTGNSDTVDTARQACTTLYRNSTNVAGSGQFSNTYGASSRLIANNSFSYLDSPATTSATTYTVYFACFIGTSVIFNQTANGFGDVATIQLLEIAG